MGRYSKLMSDFNEANLPNLDTCVLGALEKIEQSKLQRIDISKKKRIGVFGSGNALETGMILFEEFDSVFLSESVYKRRIKYLEIDLAVIISASGGKDSKRIAKYLKKKKIESILLTNNKESKAAKYVGKTLVFPKQREPYTYNTSTYLSMIFSKTKESPKKIISSINKLDKKIPKNLSKYKAFNFIVPIKFDNCKNMFETKFDELFGPNILGRAFSFEEEKHAKNLIESNKEMFVTIGEENKLFGKRGNRFHISLSNKADYAEVISLVYYFIGNIQKQNEPYFKENIPRYVKEASKLFGEKIEVIVE